MGPYANLSLSRGTSYSPGRSRFHEEVRWDGGRLAWQWETPEGKTGAVSINGVDYDPAAGVLFLVSTRGGQIHVLQFKRDLSDAKPEESSFEKLAKHDPDVVRFIAEASKAERGP